MNRSKLRSALYAIAIVSPTVLQLGCATTGLSLPWQREPLASVRATQNEASTQAPQPVTMSDPVAAVPVSPAPAAQQPAVVQVSHTATVSGQGVSPTMAVDAPAMPSQSGHTSLAALPAGLRHHTATAASHAGCPSCGVSAHGGAYNGCAQCGPMTGEGGACAPGASMGAAPYFNPYLLDPNEFICDGGDQVRAARARISDMDRPFVGIEPEDTVVRYTTDAGDTLVQPSNKVCLYAPRFASVRRVSGAESGELAVGPNTYDRPQGPTEAQLNQPGLALAGRDKLNMGDAVRGPDSMRVRDRGVPVERVLRIEVAEEVLAVLESLALLERGELRDQEKPWIAKAAQAAIAWTIDEQVSMVVNDLAPATITRDLRAEEFVVYDFPDAGRLRLCKMADKSDALPGDIVTFFLRVDNVGDSAVNKVILTDSLVTRLEYVADSQKCSVKAEFSIQPNEAQSEQLTWKLAEPLQVGEGATIEFKCRVR